MKSKLSPYHEKYLSKSDAVILETISCKEQELKQVLESILYIPSKSLIKIAVLGCGVKYFVKAHQTIFKKLLGVDVDITTFDITLDHLQGETGIVQHDCTLPIPNGPYDIIYESVLLKFIKTDRQWDVLLNSYNALSANGVAIHLLSDEKSNKVDVNLGHNNIQHATLKEKIANFNIDFKEIEVVSGPNLKYKELGWIFKKNSNKL